MFNNKFTKKDPVAEEINKIISEEPTQIDEISGDLAVRYKKKALGDKPYDDAIDKVSPKRQKGISLAHRKISQSLSNYAPGRHAKVPVTWKEGTEHTFADYLIDSYKNSQFDIEQIDEKEMSPAQQKKKEEIVLSMKDKTKEFKAKYGKRWKDVMYATATKMAMKEETLDENLTDLKHIKNTSHVATLKDKSGGKFTLHKDHDREGVHLLVNKDNKIVNGYKGNTNDVLHSIKNWHGLKKIKEESEDHWDVGYKHAMDHALDSGNSETARHRKNEMLADNPHKKGTEEHKQWHAGAKQGHSDGIYELRGESVEISERWDDEDDDVARADRELARMKAKPIKPHEKTDPDKEISKLAKKTPKEVDEEFELNESDDTLGRYLHGLSDKHKSDIAKSINSYGGSDHPGASKDSLHGFSKQFAHSCLKKAAKKGHDVQDTIETLKKTKRKERPKPTGEPLYKKFYPGLNKEEVDFDEIYESYEVYEDVEQIDENYADMSHAAKELVLHADNDHHLHHSSHTPIMNNLKKKMKKGVYHPEKAKKLWAYHADRAAQSYAKHHGDGTPWHKMFSTSDRKAAASHWEDMHRHELHEAKDPSMDAGCGSEQPFVTNANTTSSPLMKKIKDVAAKAHSRIKNEMLGKAGATSEEVDPSVKSTDMLKGRVKGGKSDDVGPGADGKSTKIKFTPGPK